MEARALLLINQASRRGADLAHEARERLEAGGVHVVAAPSPEEMKGKTLSGLIREYAATVDLVIVGGGDGSMNLSLDGLIDTGLPLGVLPMGTANNLARSLQIPDNIPAACDIIAAGNSRRIDLGCVNGRYFLNVAGLGLSSQINRRVPKDLKKRWGVVAYAVYAFKIARRMRPLHAHIVCDGNVVSVKTLQITVCNGRHYGAGMTIAADAQIDDGALDLLSTEVTRWWEGLRLLPALMHGSYEGKSGLRTMRGKEILLETRRPHWIDTDGEITVRTPARFTVVPSALRVFAP